ncbi:MAG TPA: hypothetical protein VFZ85_18805 [Jiangellaceae bacterium]
MAPVLYADFGFPCCCLAGRGVDALTAAGFEVDWRAVEREPRLTVSARPWGPDERAAVDAEFAIAAPLLADGALSSALPGVVPNTRAAVSGYAAAYEAGVAADVRRVLLEGYWVEHADIGDPEVLRTRLAGPLLRGNGSCEPMRRFGYAVSMNREPITTSAWRRVRSWRAEWLQLGTGTLPTLIDDGETVSGASAVLRRLVDHVVRLGAKVNPDHPDPARYPQIQERPSKHWISQVGGRWAHAWMGP